MDTIHSDIPAAQPEERDANIPIVVWTTVGILAMVIVCMLIAAAQFKFEEKEAPKGEASVFSNVGKLPPGPRLQVFEGKDLVAFKATQLEKAQSYGWVDKEGGFAHVPVEKGMEMILKNGLPVVPVKPATAKPAAKPAAMAAAKQ